MSAQRAHSVKGASSLLGLYGISDTAWCVEVVARALNPDISDVLETPDQQMVRCRIESDEL